VEVGEGMWMKEDVEEVEDFEEDSSLRGVVVEVVVGGRFSREGRRSWSS